MKDSEDSALRHPIFIDVAGTFYEDNIFVPDKHVNTIILFDGTLLEVPESIFSLLQNLTHALNELLQYEGMSLAGERVSIWCSNVLTAMFDKLEKIIDLDEIGALDELSDSSKKCLMMYAIGQLVISQDDFVANLSEDSSTWICEIVLATAMYRVSEELPLAMVEAKNSNLNWLKCYAEASSLLELHTVIHAMLIAKKWKQRQLAKARHGENIAMKQEAKDFYFANKPSFSKKARAIDAIRRQVPIEHSTASKWITDFENELKNNSSVPADEAIPREGPHPAMKLMHMLAERLNRDEF